MDDDINLSQPDKVPEWARREGLLGPATCSAVASAINEVEEWRIGCNWKSTDPEWDATLKTVIAFAREGQRLAAQPNEKS